MKIFPAIDLKNASVVRLTQGDYDRIKVYSSDPCGILDCFAADGAEYLHVVDLDGAKDGTLSNYETVRKLAAKNKMFIEVGGGIRDFKRIEKYLEAGVGRVILGTVAVRNFDFVVEAVKRFGDKIAVGVDAKDGMVAVSGWLEVTEIPSVDFCKKLKEEANVKTIIYTDISKDGAMQGTNLEIYEVLKDIGVDIVASGGISFEYEIERLRDMGIYGAILGKALYENKLSLKKSIEIAKK